MNPRTTRSVDPDQEPSSSPGSPSSLGDGSQLPPFFNKTFRVYRASPLFLGEHQLTESRLEVLSRRLKETLLGDAVRGVQIAMESSQNPSGENLGALSFSRIRWFSVKELFQAGNNEVQPTQSDISSLRGLVVEIHHERGGAAAYLLPGDSMQAANSRVTKPWGMIPGETPTLGDIDDTHFLQLPLLLFRGLRPLQKVVIEWLSSIFDTRISAVSMGTKTIIGVWESWIPTAALPESGNEMVTTLSFSLPKLSGETDEEGAEEAQPGLQTIEVGVLPGDLRMFLRQGESLTDSGQGVSPREIDARERWKLSGGNSDNGWAWLQGIDKKTQPFTEALAAYLKSHLALDLFHPSVRVTQISCDGFVLAESQLKIMSRSDMTQDLSQAAWEFLKLVGEKAKGQDIT